MMQVDYILEKGTANTNEDCLVIQDNIFGVFDGATSLANQTFYQGKTGGLIASQTARSVFKKNHYPLRHLACQANEKIMGQMLENGVNTSNKENLWSTSAAVVRLKTDGIEWVQAGDAVIILVYGNGSYKVLVDREDHDHETLTLWKTMVEDRMGHAGAGLNGTDTEDQVVALKQALAPQIKKVRMGMNVTYGVLNGEKTAEGFLNQGHVSLENVTDVLLFTDGLSIPSKTPERQKDFSALVDDYLTLGLEGVKERIRNTEKTDPLCLTFPRFKCHDDIAAIALRF